MKNTFAGCFADPSTTTRAWHHRGSRCVKKNPGITILATASPGLYRLHARHPFNYPGLFGIFTERYLRPPAPIATGAFEWGTPPVVVVTMPAGIPVSPATLSSTTKMNIDNRRPIQFTVQALTAIPTPYPPPLAAHQPGGYLLYISQERRTAERALTTDALKARVLNERPGRGYRRSPDDLGEFDPGAY
ncbi:MAG: hypothetical protein IPI07_18705 [Flavobacteriales bacterium]|nr:hypothetical protein [Flavobacteriales bacterium]